jgi:hypothetical protein
MMTREFPYLGLAQRWKIAKAAWTNLAILDFLESQIRESQYFVYPLRRKNATGWENSQ